MYQIFVAQQHGFLTCSPFATLQTAENTKTSEIEHLFPLPVPPRPRCLHAPARDRIQSSRRRARWSIRYLAWQYAELLVAICNSWVLQDAGQRAVFSGPPSALQAAGFDRLVLRLMSTLRPCPTIPLGEGRGSLTLNRMLDAFSSRWELE